MTQCRIIVTCCYNNIVAYCYYDVNSQTKKLDGPYSFGFAYRRIKAVIKMVGLREIRKKKGYTQLKVAMDLSISREALSYYENGKRSPDLQMLLLLSQYFDVSVDYLITGKNFTPKYGLHQ